MFDTIYSEYQAFTNNFFKGKKIEEIKEKSQYFTPLEEVDKMTESLLFTKNDKVKILDPACGNGILVLKLIEKIFSNYKPKELIIDAFDTDINTLDILKKIMINSNFNNTILNTFNEDFLNYNTNEKYNYIIMNPPYKKINVDDVPEKLRKYIYGQPNLYHLFILKALSMLIEDGVLCVISPKNYLSGKYTENLRHYILDNFSITNIHTFNDRRKIFDINIIQEICILHIEKSNKGKITVSYNGQSKFETKLDVILIDNNSKIIQTPRNSNDLDLLDKFKKFPIGTIGKDILMKTGKVVQFRVKKKENNLQEMSFNNFKNGIPLIVYRHINTNKLKYEPLKNKIKNTAITLIDDGENDSLFIKNANYLFIRKNTDKKYRKLIHSIAYLNDINIEKLAIDNGIAYFTNNDDSLTEKEVLGLQCIMMSKQFDDYYRMINSSHTINVYELENMHFPDIKTIRKIGSKVKSKLLSVNEYTQIFEDFLR